MKTPPFFEKINLWAYQIGLSYVWYHTIIAGIAQILLTLAINPDWGAGIPIGFYIGREIRDWEKLGRFDFLSLAAPLITNLIIYYLWLQF